MKSFLQNLALALLAVPFAAHAVEVDFTLSLDPVDSGATYRNFHEADKGTGDVFAVGFQLDVTAIDGVATNFATPFAAFCTELQEPIGIASYTFDAIQLGEIARGRAGEAGTASSSIPVGGIGDLRAARARFLFDQHYVPVLADWTVTTASPETHAFQLALWEITHDSDLSLIDTSSSIYVGAQSQLLQQNGLALAQSWLNDINSAGITAGYESTTWDIWALEDVGTGGAAGAQDVLWATPVGSGDSETLEVAGVPEPSSALLLTGALTALALRRRRREA